MISEIVTQVCSSLDGLVGSIPFVGDIFGQVCTWLVSLLEGFGL